MAMAYGKRTLIGMDMIVMGMIVALGGAGAQAAPLTVYSNDFDSGAVLSGGATGGLSGVTATESVQGYAGLGSPGNQFGGAFLRNFSNPPVATTLSLANLPSHDSVDVNFLLAIIDSWDSTDGSPAPDLFQVYIDGAQVISNTFANASGTVTQPVGTDIGSGATGRGFGNYNDRAYDAGTDGALTVAHSASTLTVAFTAAGGGWQGGSDESWAIDNLNIVVNTVGNSTPLPEPAPLAVFLLGLAGLGVAARRRLSRRGGP